MDKKPPRSTHPVLGNKHAVIPPLSTTKSGPSTSNVYRTTQLRRERFKKIGSCKSAPLRSPTKTDQVPTDNKSYSSTDLFDNTEHQDEQQIIPSVCDSSSDNPILTYIKSSRKSLGLETEPTQYTSHQSETDDLRESLLVSSGPIAGVKDLKVISRRLSGLTQNSDICSKKFVSDANVQFVYALSKEDKKRCNAYDLCITQAEKARAKVSYYTVSAFSVSEIDSKGGMETTGSLRWLWERNMFYRITSIPYFKNFMIRRAFIVWHEWISHRKRSKHLMKMKANLFSADVCLQKAISQIQVLCETASSSAFSHYFEREQVSIESEIKFIDVSESTTYTLNEFVSLQDQAIAQAKHDLLILREDVVNVIVSVCQEVVNKEQIAGLCEQETSDDVPSHTQVLKWRVTLERLQRFVRLCGNLVIQLLQRLVLKAVSTLLFLVKRSVRQALSQIHIQDKHFQNMRDQVTSNPYTQGILDRHDISLDEDEGEGVDHMGLVSLQASSFTSLLPSAEMGVGSLSELIEPITPPPTDNQLSAHTSNQDLLDITEFFKEPETPIVPLWQVQLTLECDPSTDVSFSPSADHFKSALSSLLNQYELLLKEFTSLSSDERIRPFVSSSKYDLLMILEEEAVKQGERKGTQRGSSWIDSYSVLHRYGPYQNMVDQLHKCLALTMVEVQRRFRHYQCYSKMVDLCKSVDIQSSLSREMWTVPMFQRAFALYHDQVHAMEGMVLSFQVGVVDVIAGSYQQDCLAYPQHIIAVLEDKLPRMAAVKCDQLSNEIKVTTEKMLETPTDVHSFIQYLTDVDCATTSIPLFEKRLLNATNMYNVAQQFDVHVSMEDMALYKSLFPQFRHLKNVLMQAQATKSETVYQFSTDLRAQVVDVLKQAVELRTAIESPSLLEEGLLESSDKALQTLEGHKGQLDVLLEQAKDYMEYYHVFGTIPSSTRRFHTVDSSVPSWTPEEVYDEVVSVSQSLKARQGLFQIKMDWNIKLKQWKCEPIGSLNISDIQREVNSFINQADYLEKELSSSNKIVSSLQAEVAEFRSWLPTLSCLLNPALKIRHWEVIQKITGETTSLSGNSLTVDYLNKMKVFDHHSKIATVSNEANHEAALENMLKKISGQWLARELLLVPHRGLGERATHILGGVEDLLASIEDSLMTINTLKSSKFVTPIKHSVVDWQRRLELMIETVECWIHCQTNWLYLESIFSAVDIQRQLSSEAMLFLRADKSWREVIRVVSEKPTALKATSTPGVLESFQTCNVLLEQVFRSLEDFLETKRVGFARFYFISNEELLDILAHTKEPLTVQPYLGKLFTNIRKLDAEVVSPVAALVHAVVSSEDERIELYKDVNARGPPEKWLKYLEATSSETVRRLIENGLSSYDEALRVEWTLNQPGQVSLAVALIKWTGEVYKCLRGESPVEDLKTLHHTWNRQISDLAKVCEGEDMPTLKQGVLASLLTLDVHCRDVVQQLSTDGVTKLEEFQWNRHLRYYWDGTNCYVQQCCAQFPYGNEYLGCLPRLVVTPLTERCYLTLTTALHLHLGGLLLGPAGTGKSESVKDLAKAMGRFCLLINCSESLDHKVIGQLFSGLCQSGTWCCFDEFNRISVDVLSVLAQQLKCIKEAKERKAIRFLFEGREIKLDANCGVFITLNPSYAGRVELPDNVKVFFRPVAMMVPDTTKIAEVLLLSSGFSTASKLAVKLTKFYEFMVSQVSFQAHYDFGLRAVKAVVSASKSNLWKLMNRLGTTAIVSRDVLETKSLVNAILEFNLSKLLSKDVVVMRMLLEDFFGSESSRDGSVNKQELYLKEQLELAAESNRLQLCDSQLQKCSQLYSSLVVRHGVVILGPTGTGKSTIIKLLKKALNLAGSEQSAGFETTSSVTTPPKKRVVCEMETINPKCVSIGELYGYVDRNTLEWKNGILPKVLKKFCDQIVTNLFASKGKAVQIDSSVLLSEASSSTSLGFSEGQSQLEEEMCPGDVPCTLSCPSSAPVGWKWIVLDGPVDPMWIENLNSALDDSKLLCLSNNERIYLQPGLRLLFETDSLDNASPATVSRCGMVFMDTQLICWKQYVNSWISKLPTELSDKCKSHIRALFYGSIEEGNLYLKKHKSNLLCPLPVIGAVKTLCHILESLLDYSIKELPSLYQNDPGASTTTHEAQDSSNSIGVQTLAGIYIPTKASKQQEQISLNADTSKSRLFDLIGKLFVFSYTWAYGGCFDCDPEEEEDDTNGRGEYQVARGGVSIRSKFDAFVHKIFSSTENSSVNVNLPCSADLIFSYFVNVHTCTFVQWKTLIPSPKQIATKVSLIRKGLGGLQTTFSSPFFEDSGFSVSDLTAANVPLIPTVNTVQLTYLASLLAQSSANHIMIAGKEGVGKSQLLHYLSSFLLSKEKCKKVTSSLHKTGMKKSFSFSSKSVFDSDDKEVLDPGFSYNVSTRTTSSDMQSVIESHCNRSSLSVLSPAMGEKVVTFLDDINMSATDQFGSQQSSELLRQLLDKGGWYDRKNLIWKDVNGVQVVATCGKHGWGYTNLSERCLSKFSLFSLPEPSLECLHSVFSAHITTAFSISKFSQEVVKSISSLVSCAVYAFQEVRSQLKPSPTKPQYTFCTRDLSKVFSRLLHINHRGLKTVDDVIQVLTHELMRVFKDKCYPEDRDKVLNILCEGLRIHFKVVKPVQELKEQSILYEDFTSSLGGYSAVKNPKKLVKNLERIQNQYNVTEDKDFQLSFFPQFCEHIVRLTRVLQQPRGNLILLGVGGLGKRSCAQLSAYIAKTKYHCLVPSDESPNEILDEIKNLVIQCGVSEQPICLLATENLGSQQTEVLCVLHELMTGGDLRALFGVDEVENILSQMSEILIVKDGSGYHLSTKELWESFVHRVLHNLHVSLCLAPSSQLLSLLQRSYHGVFTHSTIDVFDEWNSKALYGVAVKEILCGEASKSDLKLKDIINQLAAICVKMHGMVLSAVTKGQGYSSLSFSITPASFIAFVQRLCTMLLDSNVSSSTKRAHLEAGLQQLWKTNETVEQMRAELSQLQPEVESKAKEVESLLCELVGEQQQVESLGSTVAEEKAIIAKETEQVIALKKEAEDDLRTVIPAMREAERGLKALKKADLQEIRSYGNPPPMVVHVMSAVCLLLQQPTDWGTSKHLMADPATFLRMLYTFDKDNLPDKILSKLRKYTRDPNFNPENVAHYSVACQSFCRWVLAIENYGRVYRIVEPKRKVYLEIGDKLDAVKSKLKTKEKHLNKLEDQMSVLEEQHKVRVDERDSLQSKCDEISLKLGRAESVTRSLIDEQVRWSETMLSLDRNQVTLIGDTLLSAASLTYLGPFTTALRLALLTKWKQICIDNKTPVKENFKLEETLGDLEQIQQWYVHGLPKDPHSVQNALITTHSVTAPLMIDPQGQASRWIKNYLLSSALKVLSFSSEELIRDIKEAVITGVPVLVEDVPEQLSSKLEPFLTRLVEIKDGQMLLKIRKTEIEYNPAFRLYLVCPKPCANLSSEICNKTTLVNFTCTPEGLQDQLLSVVIKLMLPELDSAHSGLMLAISDDKRELKELENDLLDILRTNEGSVLEDEELIEALQHVKQVATEVKERLEAAQRTEEELVSSRQQYLPVAKRGSLLYGEIQSLQSLSPMYEFSMEWFQQIFIDCITNGPLKTETALSDDNLPSLLSAVIENLTSTVVKRTSISISAEHYLPFVFKLCSSVIMCVDSLSASERKIHPNQWKVMMRLASMTLPTSDHRRKSKSSSDTGGSVIRRQSTSRAIKPAFLSQESWDAVNYLEKQLPCFVGLQSHIIANPNLWEEYIASSSPLTFFSKDNPDGKRPIFLPSALNSFEKLLLVQALCSEQLLTAVQQFIASELGQSYQEKLPLSLSDVLEYTHYTVPILLVLVDNKDPYCMLKDLAQEELNTVSDLVCASVGKGEEQTVMDLLHSAANKGKWVLLENCHLATSFMVTLENYLKSLQTSSRVHTKFRLFLSCKPTSSSSLSFLSFCVKVYLDPPRSMRSSMQQLLSTESSGGLTEEAFEGGNNAPVYWKQLVYQLCLFHSAINVRKIFGTVGWRASYDFRMSDLQVATNLLWLMIEQGGTQSVCWEMIQHLVGDICYGGRITNTQDKACLTGLLHMYCNKYPFKDSHDSTGESKHKATCMEMMDPSMSFAECCQMVNLLPVDNEPGLVGLNQANKHTSRSRQSKLFQWSLQEMEHTNTTKSFQNIRDDDLVLDRLFKVHEKLSSLDITVKKGHTFNQSHSSPLTVMVTHEVSEWRDRIIFILDSLQNLINALKGEGALCGELERMYQAVLMNTVPVSWAFGEELSLAIPEWLEYLTKSTNCISKLFSQMVHACQNDKPLPNKFHLPAFTSPQGFFSILKQSFSKTAGIPLEEIDLRVMLATDHATESDTNPSSVVITGVSIEGAIFLLEEGIVAAEVVGKILLPDLMCSPIRLSQVCESDQVGKYVYRHCPVYTSSTRSNYVTSVTLPSKQPNVECILKGVALIL